MTKKQDLGDSLEKLAVTIVAQAREQGVPMEDRIKALQIVGGFYLGATKIKLKLGEDDHEQTPTFTGFKALINGAGKTTPDA